MVEQKEKHKILVMAILLAGACVLTYYFHAILETGTVFTHFFYIPIILAALWWRRKGLAVAIFLAVLVIFSHLFVRAEVVTANDYLRALMFIVIAIVVAALSERIAKSHEKTAHLNAILRSIRNVNQLIAREKDRDRLIQKACENLIETRGYHSAWIALVDENCGFITAAEAGLGESFAPAIEMMKRGEFTRCGQNALEQSGIMIVKDVAADCADCLLVGIYDGRAGMAVRLEYRDMIYGILSVSSPAEMVTDADEQSLFKEVAGDIALALRDMELEGARKRAEDALRELNVELEERVRKRTVELTETNEELKQEISERKRAEERIEHLNSVLKAIRNVNQLVIVVKDRDVLLQKACDALIDARGYDAAWLGFLRDDKTFAMVKGSGFSEDITRFCEHVLGGDHPPCIKNALVQKDRLVVLDKSRECGDCFFKDACVGKEAVIIRVEHANRLFGLIAVLRAPDVVVDEEEKELLNEVAGDIAFGLHNMEMEEARKQAEDQIKASLKEKEVLLREIHHRVKNNLQVVSSLLNMQARAAKDKNTIDVLLESRDRINTMALIHTKLYESENLSQINMKGFVDGLLRQLVQGYPVPDTKITPVVHAVDRPLPISIAVPLGLVVNELLSNAFKHAFVNRKEGMIEVSLGASEEGGVSLTVSDDGVGLPEGFDIDTTKTLGLHLVKILVEDQLLGNLKVISDKGATFNIEFKIEKIEGS